MTTARLPDAARPSGLGVSSDIGASALIPGFFGRLPELKRRETIANSALSFRCDEAPNITPVSAMSRSGATTDPTRLAPPDPSRRHDLRERLSAAASSSSRADVDPDIARGRALSPLGLGDGGHGGTAGARGAEAHVARRNGGGARRHKPKKRAAPIPWKKLLWVRQSCERCAFRRDGC
jgi:hypothetical protein